MSSLYGHAIVYRALLRTKQFFVLPVRAVMSPRGEDTMCDLRRHGSGTILSFLRPSAAVAPTSRGSL